MTTTVKILNLGPYPIEVRAEVARLDENYKNVAWEEEKDVETVNSKGVSEDYFIHKHRRLVIKEPG